MLILNRRKNEGIKIGNVTVMVFETGSGRVKLGIDAPDDMDISRIENPPKEVPCVPSPSR